MNVPVKKLLSGSTLKWIAILVMLIDHIGACVLEVFVLDYHGVSPLAGMIENWEFWYEADLILRRIGRIAFPLFCFLVAEGAVHTRDIRKYLIRLGIFAVVSEIPFDLALRNQMFHWEIQNVYWTLLLGLAVIYLFQRYPQEGWIGALGLILLGSLAEVCHTDYGATGVCVIVLMYLFRERPWLRFLFCYGVLALMGTIEMWCLPAFLLIALYNGKRGRQPRYFFYGFYPVHLVCLWAIGSFFLYTQIFP